jgi:hypothetical protein
MDIFGVNSIATLRSKYIPLDTKMDLIEGLMKFNPMELIVYLMTGKELVLPYANRLLDARWAHDLMAYVGIKLDPALHFYIPRFYPAYPLTLSRWDKTPVHLPGLRSMIVDWRSFQWVNLNDGRRCIWFVDERMVIDPLTADMVVSGTFFWLTYRVIARGQVLPCKSLIAAMIRSARINDLEQSMNYLMMVRSSAPRRRFLDLPPGGGFYYQTTIGNMENFELTVSSLNDCFQITLNMGTNRRNENVLTWDECVSRVATIYSSYFDRPAPDVNPASRVAWRVEPEYQVGR